MRMRALDQLEAMKGQFGSAAGARTAALLEKLGRAKFRDPAQLIRLHEVVLFLRAYPQSPSVKRLADQILFSFARRLPRNHDPFADPDISGIAGTIISTNFSYEFARSLLTRHPRSIAIDWENFEHRERVTPALKRLIPESRDDWAVEAYPDWRAWFEKGRGSLEWLLDHLTPEIYDLMEIPIRWEPGTASRSHLRLTRCQIFYHDGPFIKREPNLIAKMLAEPPISRGVLGAASACEVAGLIVDASAARYRELYGFLHPNLSGIESAYLGRGINVFLFAPALKHQLPVRDYLCGMFFKNGVPIGYIECLIRDTNMEVGFNLYYTFRDGETAWLYAMLLKLCKEITGVASFSVDPYQIGHDNEEAIASGAFWFYRKLGFAPESKGLWPLLSREERKIEAQNGYRTPPATLRKLASGRLVYRTEP